MKLIHSTQFTVLILVILATAACSSNTTDNGAPKMAAAAESDAGNTADTDTASGTDTSAPSCTCTKAPGSYCKFLVNDQTLTCQTFSGGCDNSGACKTDASSVTTTSCDADQVWKDTKTGKMAFDWTPNDGARFVCVDVGKTPAGCIANADCKSNAYCAADGTCQLLADGLFQCSTKSCVKGATEFQCSNSGTSTTYSVYGGICFSGTDGSEQCAIDDSLTSTIACPNGCNSATGQCIANPVNLCPASVQCVLGKSCNPANGQCETFGCNLNGCSGAGQYCDKASGICQATGCSANSCGAGQVCNNTTGKCEITGGGQASNGDIPCSMWRTDGGTWTSLVGGGISDPTVAWSTWNNIGSPDYYGVVKFTLKANEFGLTLNGKLTENPAAQMPWIIGYIGDQSKVTIQGAWAIKCDSLPVRNFDATNVALQSSSSFPTKVGTISIASNGANNYRLFYRVR